MSTENFGALMDSVRNRMETLVDYTIGEMKTLDKHFAMVVEEVTEAWAEQGTRNKENLSWHYHGQQIII